MKLLLALAAFTIPLLAQDYLDSVVEHARKEFIPGIAVAVVKDGKVVALKGYGVRRLGSTAPVTPHTLFGIASNTKVFTSAALAMLVDEGKLDWDDRVVDRLPGFHVQAIWIKTVISGRMLIYLASPTTVQNIYAQTHRLMRA
ncbi:MAG: serine hydrolase domain-containing protein [Bryobacteraceae bacterium]